MATPRKKKDTTARPALPAAGAARVRRKPEPRSGDAEFAVSISVGKTHVKATQRAVTTLAVLLIIVLILLLAFADRVKFLIGSHDLRVMEVTLALVAALVHLQLTSASASLDLQDTWVLSQAYGGRIAARLVGMLAILVAASAPHTAVVTLLTVLSLIADLVVFSYIRRLELGAATAPSRIERLGGALRVVEPHRVELLERPLLARWGKEDDVVPALIEEWLIGAGPSSIDVSLANSTPTLLEWVLAEDARRDPPTLLDWLGWQLFRGLSACLCGRITPVSRVTGDVTVPSADEAQG